MRESSHEEKLNQLETAVKSKEAAKKSKKAAKKSAAEKKAAKKKITLRHPVIWLAS